MTETGEYCIFFSAKSAEAKAVDLDVFGKMLLEPRPTGINATYNARFVFESKFHGELPASEYPKLNVRRC